jgi:hypothetical protein
MGVVYRAKDILTGLPVALKQVTVAAEKPLASSDEESTKLNLALAQEFRALAALRHPHIISVHDFGFNQGQQPYLTMEFVPGGRTILEAGAQIPMEDKVQLIIQMLQALVYLHRRGILHRDLKPTNALVSQGQLKLLDFGLSVITTRTREHLTETTAGTIAYIAPEIFQGEPYSQASDLYAVGVIAFQLLTGQYPYNESNMATMLHDILAKQVDASSFGIQDNLSMVLNRLLVKQRAERYQAADQVIRDLSAAANLAVSPETEEIRESFLQAAKFVGRETELSHLTGRLEETTQGHGGGLLIAGESGVGKSRLLDEFRIIALVEGLLVMSGQAVSDGRRLYELWREVLPALALYADLDDHDAAILKPLAPRIDQLLMRDVPVETTLNPQTAQEQLVSTISNMLSRLQQPAVIILEDIQWAGSESIQLLNELVDGLKTQPVLLIGSFRDDEPQQFQKALAPIESLTLQRLSEQDIAELSTSMLGEIGSDPTLVDLLHHETEGNAFFLVEAVRALAEEAGQLDNISPRALPEFIVSGGIRAILERRLSRVPEEALPLLQLASVAGRELDLALLRLLEPQIDLDSWLATCTNIAVLEPHAETWRFSHDKLREQIRDTLSHHLHHELHWRVAVALETLYPDKSEYAAALAHHWAVAEDPDKELHYLEIAGNQAVQNSANIEAIRLLERALELLSAQSHTPERDRRELELQIALGPLLLLLGKVRKG